AFRGERPVVHLRIPIALRMAYPTVVARGPVDATPLYSRQVCLRLSQGLSTRGFPPPQQLPLLRSEDLRESSGEIREHGRSEPEPIRSAVPRVDRRCARVLDVPSPEMLRWENPRGASRSQLAPATERIRDSSRSSRQR